MAFLGMTWTSIDPFTQKYGLLKPIGSMYQVIQAVTFWSPIVGGHLTNLWKGHVFTPKRALWITWYDIFTNIYYSNQPNVGEYFILGSRVVRLMMNHMGSHSVKKSSKQKTHPSNLEPCKSKQSKNSSTFGESEKWNPWKHINSFQLMWCFKQSSNMHLKSNWLVVSTHLKNIAVVKMGSSSPTWGKSKTYLSCHHPANDWLWQSFAG